MIVGPSALHLVRELMEIETLSQLGVILLMFDLGVDFRFGELKRVGAIAAGGGTLQMLVTILVIATLSVETGLVTRWKEGLFLGACVGLSSTAVVVKVLKERKQMETEHGKVCVFFFSKTFVIHKLKLILKLALDFFLLYPRLCWRY
jgi:CPA2 family monovalent cation:H+ antiporter-2